MARQHGGEERQATRPAGSAAKGKKKKGGSQLPALPTPGPLEATKRRSIISLQLLAAVQRTQGDCTRVSLALGGRLSIKGLSGQEAGDLLSSISAPVDQAQAKTSAWDVVMPEGVRVAVLSKESDIWDAAAGAPHLICLRSGILEPGASPQASALLATLRRFRGSLLVLEEPDSDTSDVVSALGVSSRCVRDREMLAPMTSPIAPSLELLEDLSYDRLRNDTSLAPLLPSVEALFKEHFHDDGGFMASLAEGSLVALVVAVTPGGEAADAPVREVAGFIVYKHWRKPERAMSISRIAVSTKYRMLGCGRRLVTLVVERAEKLPQHECTAVTLCSLPTSVPFYEQLQFTAIPKDELRPGMEATVPGSVKMRRKSVQGRVEQSRKSVQGADSKPEVQRVEPVAPVLPTLLGSMLALTCPRRATQ